MNLLAAHTDNALRRLAEKGDTAARDELIRRGLYSDPTAAKRTVERAWVPWRDRRHA